MLVFAKAYKFISYKVYKSGFLLHIDDTDFKKMIWNISKFYIVPTISEPFFQWHQYY